MPSNGLRITDGSVDFSGGVDSGRVSTVKGDGIPNGLARNQLAWMTNCTARGGGISHRFGWIKLASSAPWSGIYQGGFSYQPDEANPHLVLKIGGQVYRVMVDEDNRVEQLIIPDGITTQTDQAFFAQGERFLVIQEGDFVTNPLFYDGISLRRSNGLSGSPRELPPAGAMDYFMGRIWYAIGRTYVAGDIVNGPSGTPGDPYRLRDSILRVTENPLAIGGDGFIVPTTTGNIRALRHSSNLNTALGQGSLFVFTRKAIYVTDPPVKRADWIATTEPLQRVAQNRYGAYGDRCVVPINGDLFYQSTDGIRSLFTAVRNFNQWGNTPISSNEDRVLVFNNRALMRFSSGIEFDNRLLQAILPVQTPVGVAFQGLVPLDFDLISTLQEKLPPAWEGLSEGLDFLQLFEGDFGGLQRAFAVAVSRITGEIEVWELTQSELTDEGDARVQWQFETPSYTWNNPFQLKQLDGGEIWIDRLHGTVRFVAEYRTDQSACWNFWCAWDECAARDCHEDPSVPLPCPDYPEQLYCPAFKATMALPTPPINCEASSNRPSTIGYQFQFRLKIRGSCRVRGVLLHALERDKAMYDGIVCGSMITEPSPNPVSEPTPPAPEPIPEPEPEPEPEPVDCGTPTVQIDDYDAEIAQTIVDLMPGANSSALPEWDGVFRDNGSGGSRCHSECFSILGKEIELTITEGISVVDSIGCNSGGNPGFWTYTGSGDCWYCDQDLVFTNFTTDVITVSDGVDADRILVNQTTGVVGTFSLYTSSSCNTFTGPYENYIVIESNFSTPSIGPAYFTLVNV